MTFNEIMLLVKDGKPYFKCGNCYYKIEILSDICLKYQYSNSLRTIGKGQKGVISKITQFNDLVPISNEEVTLALL